MKRSFLLAVCSLLSPVLFAGKPVATLDKVGVQLTARQWVSTQTALVTVDVNATLTSADLVRVRSDIMAQLGKIGAGTWHITTFERSQDSSGLEKLFVEAQARIPESGLSNLYNAAKSASKPGTSYTIAGVEFRPGLEEMQKARSMLRETLYRQVQEEIARINAVYTDEHYSLNRLIFVEGDSGVPAPQMMKARGLNMMAVAPAPVAPVAVSNELIMTATAILASGRIPPGPPKSAGS